MSLGNGFASKDGGTERTREGVASANGVGNSYLRSLAERHSARCEDVRAVGAAGEYQHVKVVLAQDEPALILHIESWVVEHTPYEDKLLVVDLKDVATTQRLLDDFLGVELLTQVDVENLHAVGGGVVEELVYCLA